jgi:HPt (histidine-containing phosphotransfer) domain-containing protein
MVISAALSIFVLIVVWVIYREYKNEKRYQAERRARHGTEQYPQTDKAPVPPLKNTKDADAKLPPGMEETAPILPVANYGRFDHSRLIDMGLSSEEANAFVQELITQVDTQIPLIKEAMEKEDFIRMERLTHSLKGSATNIGTGGISDLLVKYNTYLKTGKQLPVAKAYFAHLQESLAQLRSQYA